MMKEMKIVQRLNVKDSTTVKCETKVIKSKICDYSDAYILVTGNITETGGNENTASKLHLKIVLHL